MSAKQTETVVEKGTEIFIPLNKLKKSPKNERKTPHSVAAIEAYAASIAAKGIILQNLVVEPGAAGSVTVRNFAEAGLMVVMIDRSLFDHAGGRGGQRCDGGTLGRQGRQNGARASRLHRV
jgi:hypothetical protein